MLPLLLDISPDKADRYLSWWHWKTGEDVRPVAVTTFGDWIFERADGSVHHLSITLSASCGSDDAVKETGWDAIRNPVLAYPDLAIKDAFMVQHEGRWHLGYSEIPEQSWNSGDPFQYERSNAGYLVDARDRGVLLLALGRQHRHRELQRRRARDARARAQHRPRALGRAARSLNQF